MKKSSRQRQPFQGPSLGRPGSGSASARAKRPANSSKAKGTFTALDGADLYFEDTGGDEPVLFYVYGLACSVYHWKYPMAYLSREAALARGGRIHRQVWMDFRGHGRSPFPSNNSALTMARITQDIAELCAYRGITSATFLGQSMGGSIVLELCRLERKLVKGMVLLATPGRDVSQFLPIQPLSGWLWHGMNALNRRVPQLFHAAGWITQELSRHPWAILPIRELIRQSGFNPDLVRTSDIDEYLQQVLRVPPSYFYDMAADLSEFDIANISPPLNVPSLIIAGGKDQLVPPTEAERLRRYLPASELALVPHGSHCPHFDDPGLVNRLLADFLDRHGL